MNRTVGILLTVVLLLCMRDVLASDDANHVTVGINSRTIFYLPLWIAERQGYFRDEGVDVSVQLFSSADTSRDDLLAGKVQVSIAPPEAVLTSVYTANGPFRIIAGNARKLPHFIIARKGIKTLADLKGANFGVISMHEGTTYLVPKIAKAAGLRVHDYSVTAVGGAPTRQRLLLDGKLDVGLQPFPLSYEAEAAGLNNLGWAGVYEPDWQFTTINADQNWARSHRMAVTGFLRGLRRANDYIASHPNESAQVAAQELKTSVPLAARAISDSERLGILDPELNWSDVGIRRVFEAMQSAGAIASDARFDLQRVTDDSFLTQSQNLTVRSTGNFFIGGAPKVVSGLATQDIHVVRDAPPLRVDSNGTYIAGQVYVEFTKLARPRFPFPILFLNGGTFTGAMWQTTPDGRPGWSAYFQHAGFDTYLTDAVGKGRASWAMYPTVYKVPPIFRSNESTFALLRIGPPTGATSVPPHAYEDTQFPIDHVDDLFKEGVPRFAGQDESEFEAYRELIKKVGPCVIVAQSSGAYFGLRLAREEPSLVKALVAVELTAVPSRDQAKDALLARLPQLLLWGDHLNSEGPGDWPKTVKATEDYATAINASGGQVDVVHLPSSGIKGNTHVMMMDRNSDDVANVAVEWLRHSHVDDSQ
ncbi:ABC-type nitrate/sulfonate/bicarbonate transport system, substrate-binding protein [Paraburkholderia steynii]|uniref:ABC-type nitrate/sulfonate/bicarbonate transport system, substrate-binding protein n=1 Tax=Paraburkholderia steynii TaxID=1245441 RepID=A0A7Z7B3W0_9BURK|nr:ABC transporter substrate-binding protein [Paraburkholderia steynii]SDH24530.1 ABC-type nitrate/sulfonate/bicarbonate transport system, substrate-binding protein [Paraburkholderia steynii]